jgi:DNA invertase Pin-like site-specific DNA recombinase
MIQAYGCIRVSHAEQAESGLSLEAQRQECHRYWERFLKPKAVFAEWSSRITSERIKAAQAILRQQRRPRGGKRLFGYRVVGQKGNRRLAPDREERAILVRIIRAVEIEGIVAWDKLSTLAQKAAAEIYAAKPDAVRRTWSESTVRRAVDGFWRLVHTEGTDWICDPAVKGLTMMKMAAAVSQASKRTV